MASPISIYLSDEVLHKLDAMVARQAELDRAAGLEGRQIMSRSKMISELILQSGESADQLDVERIEYAVVKLAEEYGAKKVSLFGSFARGEQRPDSDVDILLEKGAIKGMKVLDFQDDLARALDRKVDVVTTAGASDRFLGKISADAITLYEADHQVDHEARSKVVS